MIGYIEANPKFHPLDKRSTKLLNDISTSIIPLGTNPMELLTNSNKGNQEEEVMQID